MKNKNIKSNHLVIDGLTITSNQLKYQYNGWSCGYGKFKNKKAYSRKSKYPAKYNY